MNPIAFILQVLAGQNMMIIDLLELIVALLGAMLCMQTYKFIKHETKIPVRFRKLKGGLVRRLKNADWKLQMFFDNRK